MASEINFYSELVISAIRISDINNLGTNFEFYVYFDSMFLIVILRCCHGEGPVWRCKMNVSNHNANDVLSGVARNIREITRLLTNDSRNKDLCLQKVDICLSHISSVRGVLEDGQIDPVEASLHALRAEILNTVSGGTSSDLSYSAHRPLCGKL